MRPIIKLVVLALALLLVSWIIDRDEVMRLIAPAQQFVSQHGSFFFGGLIGLVGIKFISHAPKLF